LLKNSFIKKIIFLEKNLGQKCQAWLVADEADKWQSEPTLLPNFSKKSRSFK